MSAEAGSFKMSRTPYLAGIVDVVCEPGVEEIVFVKPTQVGGSTAGEILLGYWIDNDPGPCLTVLPSEGAVEENVKDRLRPLLEGVPVLAAHMSPRPHDNTLSSIKLDSMALYFGWAGSPQSLASRPCRYLRCDEVDKYPPYSGRESDPLSLAMERTATYLHRKRIFKTSTPTTRDGAIWRAFEACGDRRTFHVPCPTCGTFQQLTWPQVKWPKLDIADKIKRADEIERSHLAWYECLHCKGRIEESQKPRMVERGLWVSEGQTVSHAGLIEGERPHSKRVGFHLSSLYSPWRKLWEMAAEFIRAEGDISLTMNFRNSRLGEPFEIQISRTESSTIERKATNGPPAKIVPKWAKLLIATADTQKDHFYYVVRAWGYEYQSQLVDYGICSTFEELKGYTINASLRLETGETVHPHVLLIDSGGNRTNEVYQFALSDPQRIKPTKGASGRLTWPVDKSLQRAMGLVLWNIDTQQTKDLLNRLIHDPDETRWMPHASVNADYCFQMASEHKVINPQTKKEEWKQKTSGAANHFWDCEQQQCAAAFDMGVGQTAPQQNPAYSTPPPQQSSDWLPDRTNWMKR